MASNENFQPHFSPQMQKPPSPSLKTHPTRRRIIRKSPRHSIRLTTLRKTSTISPGNNVSGPKQDPSDRNSSTEYVPTPGDAEFERLSGNPLEKTPTLGAPGGSEALLRLFSCPGCVSPLREPVTLECGHTCCKDCGVDKCPECGVPVEKTPAVNVLVRNIVSKLIGDPPGKKLNLANILSQVRLCYTVVFCK